MKLNRIVYVCFVFVVNGSKKKENGSENGNQSLSKIATAILRHDFN